MNGLDVVSKFNILYAHILQLQGLCCGCKVRQVLFQEVTGINYYKE